MMEPSLKYDCFAILGRKTEKPMWNWEIWSAIFPLVDTIVARSERGPSSVRCFQEGMGKFRLGRMAWNETGHQKWSHYSPETKSACKNWEFVGMEAWIPGSSICERDELPPDVFIDLHGGMGKDGSYTFLMLALAERFEQRTDIANTRSFLREAAKHLESPISGRLKSRPWAIGDRAHFSDSLQDFYNLLNFKITFQIDRIPRLADFPWGWRPFKL